MKMKEAYHAQGTSTNEIENSIKRTIYQLARIWFFFEKCTQMSDIYKGTFYFLSLFSLTFLVIPMKYMSHMKTLLRAYDHSIRHFKAFSCLYVVYFL